MGSCVSFPRSPAPSAESSSSSPRAPASTARVVSMDGSMEQFAVPATAREALLALGPGARRASSSSPPPPPMRFLCSADELGFDAPPRALAAGEALRPGQLYFLLPVSVQRRPLSGDDMAALAVRAATALAAEAGLAAGAVMSPQRRAKHGGAAGKGRRRQSTARVAPLLVVSSGKDDDGRSDDSWNNDTHGGFTKRETVHDDGNHRAVRKGRRGAPYRRSARHRRPGVQSLSAIAEDE
ncbi:unnamed protein product [Urochloa decumbens]|uniref:Uncharacterized protein n=1 Tax=Urochloa decumbens TaxID=240449 RepID=A0ABC9G5Q7_9POAL